jgi:hypothetical protein
MHTIHFIMMGSRRGFPVMLAAFAMAAFGRGFLTGKIAEFSFLDTVLMRDGQPGSYFVRLKILSVHA